MLTAVSSLGEIGNQGLESIVDRTDAVDCLEIVFDRDNYSFLGCNISSNKGEEVYLYHRDTSGKPGLFLSWTIPSTDIKRLQELLRKGSNLSVEERQELAGFWSRKFGWFSFLGNGTWSSKSKVINNKRLLDELDSSSRLLLQNICESYARSFERICKDAGKQLQEYGFRDVKGKRTSKLLVSIAFKVEASNKYPGDYESFKKIFIKAVSGEGNSQNGLTCSVCNSKLGHEVQTPPPIEFLTQDQLVYIPDGKKENKSKGIALCQDCSNKLRTGQKFMDSNLTFKIQGSKLFFWLLPILPDLKSTRVFIKDLKGDRKPLYLHNLNNLCYGLELITNVAYESEGSSESEAWLTFNSIFYYKDSNGHTRISGTAEGIYPSRLREIAQASREIQGRYCYDILKLEQTSPFLLLPKFFKEETNEAAFTHVMESLFVKNPVNQSSLLRYVCERVRSKGLTRLETSRQPVRSRMKALVITILNAYMIIEYLVLIGMLDLKGDANAMPLTENTLKSPYVDEVKKFISSHEYSSQNDTIKSVFLTGVAVGILLEVQMKEFNSYPFWKHLNRLELDLHRIASFYPQVKAKLVQYSKGRAKQEIAVLRPLIEYIGVNLNFEGNRADFDRNLVDFVFSVGLAEGYIIYHMAGGEFK